jgi:hypothetical protein
VFEKIQYILKQLFLRMSGGVVFLVCIPTAAYEYNLLFDTKNNDHKQTNLRIRKLNTEPQLKSYFFNDNNFYNKKAIENNFQFQIYKNNCSVPCNEAKNNFFISMEIVRL